MIISKNEIFLISTAIEYLYLKQPSSFSKKGLKALAKLQWKLGSEILPIPKYDKDGVEMIYNDLKRNLIHDNS